MRPPLRLFWSRGQGKHDVDQRNAGDWFAPLICERLSGRRVVYAEPKSCDLVAAGSILHRLRKSHFLYRFGMRRSLNIWGAGSIRAEKLPGAHFVHAVRGELTRSLLRGAESSVVGDPGLLADLILEKPQPKKFAIGIIPHYVDANEPELLRLDRELPYTKIISIYTPIPQLLAMISSCETIISSSLHGLIFADSLGIPNRWVRLKELTGGSHKFKDYYSVFGIEPAPLERESLVKISASMLAEGYARPGLSEIKRQLYAGFPQL